MTIGVLGPKGTFSDLALQKYLKTHKAIPYYYQTLEQTVSALEHLDRVIVPLENTLEGYVQPILDFMISQDVHIESELIIPVQYALITNAPSLKAIDQLYVQFAAKSQCLSFLNQHHLKTTLTESNVQSYERLLSGSDHDAAIVPIHLVTKPFQLKYDHITDISNNQTRFVVLSKTFNQQYVDSFTFSMIVRPTHDRPGLLYDILKIFKEYDINLSAIMSRPQKTKLGQYYFYIEFHGDYYTKKIITEALKTIRIRFDVKVLGVYPTTKEKVS